MLAASLMLSPFPQHVKYKFPLHGASQVPRACVSPARGGVSRPPHSFSPHRHVPAESSTPPLKLPPPEFLSPWNNEVEEQNLSFLAPSLSIWLLEESRSLLLG